MKISIRNIVFACPDPEALARFYSELLGWPILRTDWYVVAKSRDASLRLAFGDGPGEYNPPAWPDPERPQQMHIDIAAPDLDKAEERAIRLGATRLKDCGQWRIMADPAGHPFCLHVEADRHGREPDEWWVSQVVVDCLSPRNLATFYQQLMGLNRLQDTSYWVVIGDEELEVTIAFQHAVFRAPRWPDPAYPQQMHLDLDVVDGRVAVDHALTLGAMPLPAQGGSCPVFADPVGHPFCICSPGM